MVDEERLRAAVKSIEGLSEALEYIEKNGLIEKTKVEILRSFAIYWYCFLHWLEVRLVCSSLIVGVIIFIASLYR